MPGKELQILRSRLESLLPALMRREELDMWIVAFREDNQDPVAPTLLPPGLTGDKNIVLPPTCDTLVLVFCLREDQLERLALTSLDLEGFYHNPWQRGKEDLWQCLERIVRERNPGTIGINISDTFSHADGLSHSMFCKLTKSLGEYAKRMTSAERLAVGWLEQRTPGEVNLYSKAVIVAHEIIQQAYTSKVVCPGKTDVRDVGWWMRRRIREQGLNAWFHPQVCFHRKGASYQWQGIVQPGDVLFCDIGLEYMGLMTDTQQLAYILADGENEPPAGLQKAMATCNALQDIAVGEIAVGRTGNEILAAIRKRAKELDIQAYLNIHPVGCYGHGPGPSIGVWDRQGGVSGRGDYPVYDDTCFALELCIIQSVPEWGGQNININLEETVAVTDGQVQYLNGRQTRFHLIGQ